MLTLFCWCFAKVFGLKNRQPREYTVCQVADTRAISRLSRK